MMLANFDEMERSRRVSQTKPLDFLAGRLGSFDLQRREAIVPIVHVGDYLPGIFYVRVFFEAGDERGCPWYAPLPEEDHLAAYKTFLHLSKQAAIDAFAETQHRPIQVSSERWFQPFAPLPQHEEPLEDGNDYICSCRVNENGEVDCLSRVAHLDRYRGVVRLLSFDEDFLIQWPRSYIFETHKLIDPYAPKLAM
ncbi:hypothetical protein [Bradyrhizobium sp. USDA 10063]